jgi:hypothetical protein
MNLRTVLFKLALVNLLLLFNPQTIHAEADGPDYWQVCDVEKTDVLNIRSNPDPGAPKTGEIPHDARCIKNMGCRGGLTFNEFTTLSDAEKQLILRQRPRWCRISYQGTTGWVAGRYLKEGDCPAAERKRHTVIQPGIDPYNHSYLVEKENVRLRNGCAREGIPGSSAVIITELVYPPVYADLTGDMGKEAVSVLLQHTGGSGTFYYLAVADNDKPVESYFLGDRINIISVKIVKDVITVEYLERTDSQPMAARPAIKTRMNFKLVDNVLVSSREAPVDNQSGSRQ